MPQITGEPTQPPERSDSVASQRTTPDNDRPPRGNYPSDVVAGAVLGATWSGVASRLGHVSNSADERSELPVGAQGAAWAR
jgi:hypothetical protein